MRFYVFFNNITVTSGRWTDDNERLCAMKRRLRLRRFRSKRGSNSRPLDQQASYKPTELPGLLYVYTIGHNKSNFEEPQLLQQHD